jgi:hypothetical protein
MLSPFNRVDLIDSFREYHEYDDISDTYISMLYDALQSVEDYENTYQEIEVYDIPSLMEKVTIHVKDDMGLDIENLSNVEVVKLFAKHYLYSGDL